MAKKSTHLFSCQHLPVCKWKKGQLRDSRSVGPLPSEGSGTCLFSANSARKKKRMLLSSYWKSFYFMRLVTLVPFPGQAQTSSLFCSSLYSMPMLPSTQNMQYYTKLLEDGLHCAAGGENGKNLPDEQEFGLGAEIPLQPQFVISYQRQRYTSQRPFSSNHKGARLSSEHSNLCNTAQE